jgi:hypothetical protein
MIDEKYEGTDKIIEVGDSVIYEGKVDKIIEVKSYDNCCNDYTLESGDYVEYNELEYLAGTPHKHRDLIIAWANGAEIEVMDYADGEWYYCYNPTWRSEDYRIKPTTPSKSPKQLEKERIQKEMEKLAKDLEALDV